MTEHTNNLDTVLPQHELLQDKSFIKKLNITDWLFAAALITIAQYIAAGQPTEYGVYHFSGSPYTSWHGFAGEIFPRAAEQNLLPRIPTLNAIATADYPTPARRPANSRLDCSKIQAAFGIAPSDWQAALGSLKDYV